MTALKIIGAVLAVVAVLIAVLLSLRLKISFDYAKGESPKLFIKILCFCFSFPQEKKQEKPKKKEKKPSKLALWIQKRLGIDIIASGESLKQNVEEEGISGTAEKVAAVIALLAGQIFWLLKRFRLDKLYINAVCAGGDAADAAMDYGLVCATVYPLVGYLTSNVNAAKNAEEVFIGCDFEGEPSFEFKLAVSVRTIHLVRAVLRNAQAVAVAEIGVNT